MRRMGLVMAAVALMLALAAGAALASPAAAKSQAGGRSQAVPVRLLADLECAPGGGANVAFTVRNVGKRTLTIEGDFHLFLDKVGADGRQPVSAAFVFPAPGFGVIAPGKEKTFLVPMGTGEEGEPGVDLAARRLILEAEVFFQERKRPAVRHFSFPGCAPS